MTTPQTDLTALLNAASKSLALIGVFDKEDAEHKSDAAYRLSLLRDALAALAGAETPPPPAVDPPALVDRDETEALALLREMQQAQGFSCDCQVPREWFQRRDELLARVGGKG